jgi:radical SAM protein (TIGR01212 family)
MTLEEQIGAAVAFARGRYGARRFMAYVQAFTGTFAPASEQRDLYLRVLDRFPFDALSVGTRPDCLPPATLQLLVDLKERLDVWVELGVQTAHDETLARVERGHTWAASRDAILALDANGLMVAAHVILGLPGEGPAQFRATARRLAGLPVAGVKIHNLHVVRGTRLAAEFASRPFPVYDAAGYAAVAIDFLRRLPPHVAIMRLCTDTPRDRLIAPHWRVGKSEFVQLVQRTMLEHGWRQGDLTGLTRTGRAPAGG